MKHKLSSLVIISLSSMALFTACSEKKFNSAPGSVYQKCVDQRPEVKCVQDCTSSNTCVKKYDYQIDSQAQITDILFVVDNSRSMYEEQVEMESKFPDFLNKLNKLDYRIGITTTDISSDGKSIDPVNLPNASNGYGALQDGRLISFNNGAPYLSGSLGSSVEQSYFQNTIARNETRICENGAHTSSNCPSGVERGILAAAMTIENNPSDFIRPTGHMAVVFLSDEDEGSDGYGVVRDSREYPANFVNSFRSRYPNKSLKAHSIIIQPNTNEGAHCYSLQAREKPIGQYGIMYSQLTDLTNGVQGSICAANYTSQLQEIGQSVAQTREVLPCPPINNQLKVSYLPKPSYQVTYSYNSFQNEVLFSKPLPKGTKIRFEFSCKE